VKRESSSLQTAPLSDTAVVDYPLSAATADRTPVIENMLARARAFAEPLIADEKLDTGENTLAHADAVAAIVAKMGGSEAMQAASYLVYSCQHLNRPQEVIAKVFGDNFAALAVETTKLVRVQEQARSASQGHHIEGAGAQTENVRKMLLAFSRDLRVVMLRLASRLQTLRHAAASKQPAPESVARESLQVFAPLANRLGIWQVKWEIEDLSFRFIEPETYKLIARLLDEKRIEREGHIEQLRSQLERELQAEGVHATVQGRPKNIYSIVKKMRGKSLDFAQVFDILALRVVVADVKDCYAALAWVHTHFQPIDEEFDDYIARPKPNGYQSLHTVVRELVDGKPGKPIEIQIRTEEMHDHAEHGVAAHWAYKEAGHKGYAGVWASGEYDAKIAVLRQLLAWERDLSGGSARAGPLRRPHLCADAGRGHRRVAARRDAGGLCLYGAHHAGPSLPRCACRWRDGAAQHAAVERADGRDHCGQGRRSVARLAQCRAGLPCESPRARQGARMVQRADHARDRRTRTRSGREAAAARRQDGHAARGPGFAARLQVGGPSVRGGRQGRVLAAQHRDAAAPAGAGAEPRRRRADQEGARQREVRQGRRAGGGRVVIDDAAGQVLQARAARSHRRLRDARPRRQRAPQPTAATSA
jgi:hypothetical protein